MGPSGRPPRERRSGRRPRGGGGRQSQEKRALRRGPRSREDRRALKAEPREQEGQAGRPLEAPLRPCRGPRLRGGGAEGAGRGGRGGGMGQGGQGRVLLSAPQRGPPLACLQVGRKGRMVAEPARGAQPRVPSPGVPQRPCRSEAGPADPRDRRELPEHPQQ